MESHSSVRDELFLLQRRLDVVSRSVSSLDDGRQGSVSKAIAFAIPVCLGLIGVLAVVVDRLPRSRMMLVILMLLVMMLVVGGWVGHAFLLKLAPALTSNPFAVAAIELSSTVMFLPLGVYFRDFEEVKTIIWKTAFLSLNIILFWCTFLYAFDWLSVTSLMLVDQLLPLVLYSLQVGVLDEPFVFSKFGMVWAGFAGFVVMILHSPMWGSGWREAPFGFIVCFISVIVQALYQISFLHLMPDAGKGYLSFFTLYFGLRGFWCMFFCGVGMVTLHLLGLEFEGFWISGSNLTILASATMTTWIYVFSQTAAFTRFSPVWVALASAFQIPLSALIDINTFGLKFDFLTVVGATAMVFSFVGFTSIAHLSVVSEAKYNK